MTLSVSPLSIFSLRFCLLILFLACVYSHSLPSSSLSCIHLSDSSITPAAIFLGLRREGSNLRFILPPISNLRDPRCWRPILRGSDVSRHVKLKVVKEGKNVLLFI